MRQRSPHGEPPSNRWPPPGRLINLTRPRKTGQLLHHGRRYAAHHAIYPRRFYEAAQRFARHHMMDEAIGPFVVGAGKQPLFVD